MDGCLINVPEYEPSTEAPDWNAHLGAASLVSINRLGECGVNGGSHGEMARE